MVLTKEEKARLEQGFQAAFGYAPERYFSAPGRTEIGGIQNLQTLLEPTILYNNANGSLTGITLSDNPNNYDYIEVVYADTLNHFSTERIYDTTKKSELTSIGSSNGLMYMFNKIIEFTSNSIGVDSYSFSYFSDNASPRVISEDKIRIYKVIGYKEV